MFIKVNNRWLNERNIAYIDDQDGARFVVHFVASQSPLTINSGILGDSSYSDLRAWLKSQACASGADEQAQAH